MEYKKNLNNGRQRLFKNVKNEGNLQAKDFKLIKWDKLQKKKISS